MMEQNPKKILYLITKSNFGGAQKYVYELALEAQKRGHTVQVACGGTGEKQAEVGILVEKLEAVGITVHIIKHFMRDMSLFDDIQAMFEIVRLLLKERPDILHSSSSKAGGMGAFCGRLVGIKQIIFTSHGLTMDETWRPGWQRLLITWSTWFTILLSHRTIMISTETMTRACSLPLITKRVTLIFNGIAPITFKDRAVARAELAPEISPDTLWIGGVGELHPNKNWSVLVKAMTQLPHFTHAFIIGEGEERTRLESLVAESKLNDRVHLLGYVDAPTYLNAFDIFILPSKKEGLPYVLLEAGLAGLPCVASNLPGNQDIISHEETGLLVEPSPNTVAVALKTLVAEDTLRTKYGRQLQKTVRSKFSLKQMLEDTFALYSLEQ